jgi:hypothetical protein
VEFFGAGDSCAQQPVQKIRRLDGSTISTVEAEAFAKRTLEEQKVTSAQNYMICFERSKSCMILLTNSDNGELAFHRLLEKVLGDTVTPWEWEGYTREYIEASRKN